MQAQIIDHATSLSRGSYLFLGNTTLTHVHYTSCMFAPTRFNHVCNMQQSPGRRCRSHTMNERARVAGQQWESVFPRGRLFFSRARGIALIVRERSVFPWLRPWSTICKRAEVAFFPVVAVCGKVYVWFLCLTKKRVLISIDWLIDFAS